MSLNRPAISDETNNSFEAHAANKSARHEKGHPDARSYPTMTGPTTPVRKPVRDPNPPAAAYSTYKPGKRV